MGATSLSSPLDAGHAALDGHSLSPDQIHQLLTAQKLAARIRRTATTAALDGWSIGFFGGLTLLTSLFDISGLLLGSGMIIVAAVELRGAAAVRRLNPNACRKLGFNQLALAAMLILYSLWSLHTALTGPGPFAATVAEGGSTADMLRPYQELSRSISIIVYASIIAVAVVMQGGLSLYYFARARFMEAYAKQTPSWIVQLQRAGVGL